MEDGEKQKQIKNPHTEKVQGLNIENNISNKLYTKSPFLMELFRF
jgi:hypothetical protein